MKLEIQKLNAALNRAYFRESVNRKDIDLFKQNLVRLFVRISDSESEEHNKNIVSDFLKDTYYKSDYEINTSGRKDLVIHLGKTSTEPVAVIIEAKRPEDKAGMITSAKPNAKALHELVHYYLHERLIKNNKEIRNLIITDIYQWYIFDAAEFERLFFNNKQFAKTYKDWNDGVLPSKNTDWFYQEIAKPFIDNEIQQLNCTCFNLHDYEKIINNDNKKEDAELIHLYKILSPQHLLKLSFANDSNTLNRDFYNELLHIIGLCEQKKAGKKTIERLPPKERNEGSLIENTISIIKTYDKLASLKEPETFGHSVDEQLFSVSLELCITWLNRILFLKLLEGQLIKYNHGNQDFAFLNSKAVRDFDEISELFFDVLAVKIDERTPGIKAKYQNIPYLNSSLFEISELERQTISINQLKDRYELPLFSATVLKESASGVRLHGSKSTFRYLLEFLDAYNFASETTAEIQEQNKTIINASVLGLIFEKINGYKDGSFFTPGYITMYICRETIRKTVLQKFNAKYNLNCLDFNQLYTFLDKNKIKEYNDLINSIHICDPAVGSGHFLVSALNELLAIKFDLEIVCDQEGKLLRGYKAVIENDEILITDEDQIIPYNPKKFESQRIQEAIFHEKQTIIENCLFGVDINQKSVQICRLRLWIELLKHAYYILSPTVGTRHALSLQTLPNIDINIKCGNSLVSLFGLNGNKFVNGKIDKMKKHINEYKIQVGLYKDCVGSFEKKIITKMISEIKGYIIDLISPIDQDLLEIRKKEAELAQTPLLFSREDQIQWQEKLEVLTREIADLKKHYEFKNKTIYSNAFEWRYEFPEILDDNGNFVGFDAIIGNPPYISIKEIAEYYKSYYSKNYKTATGQFDLYTLFMERSYSLLSTDAYFSMITSNTYFANKNLENIRKFLLNHTEIINLVNLDESIFSEANLDVGITMFRKTQVGNDYKINIIPNRLAFETNYSYQLPKSQFENSENSVFNINILEYEIKLFEKLFENSTKLEEIANLNRGIEFGSNSNEIIEKPKSGYYPIIAGNCIEKYKIKKYAGYALYLDGDKSTYKDFDLYSQPRILIQRIRNLSLKTRIVATYTSDTILCTNTLRVLTLTNSDFDYKFILGILNSDLINYYFRKSYLNKDIYAYQLGAIPIKKTTLALQQPVIKVIDKILEAKSLENQQELSKLESKLNALVYKLYNLTPEEIETICATCK